MKLKPLINIGFLLCLGLTTASISAETVIIDVKDSMFGTEQPLRIKVGDTVKWVNVEKRQYHSVWFEAEGFPEAEYIFPDESWERTFDKAGTYPYRCEPHEDMLGTIIVE
jgi:plastocyanin